MSSTETRMSTPTAPSPAPPAAKPVESKTVAQEWSFHYSGPKVPAKVRGCIICAAAAGGLCMATPPHQSIEAGCGLCVASKEGVCGAHGRGAKKALDDHQAALTGPEATHFKSVRALLDAELALIPDTASVRVKAFMSAGLDKDLSGERTGVAPRSLEVSVIQFEG